MCCLLTASVFFTEMSVFLSKCEPVINPINPKCKYLELGTSVNPLHRVAFYQSSTRPSFICLYHRFVAALKWFGVNCFREAEEKVM